MFYYYVFNHMFLDFCFYSYAFTLMLFLLVSEQLQCDIITQYKQRDNNCQQQRMIRSQININNSYKIMKVLITKDYLACDLHDQFYIICINHIKTSSIQSNHKNQSKISQSIQSFKLPPYNKEEEAITSSPIQPQHKDTVKYQLKGNAMVQPKQIERKHLKADFHYQQTSINRVETSKDKEQTSEQRIIKRPFQNVYSLEKSLLLPWEVIILNDVQYSIFKVQQNIVSIKEYNPFRLHQFRQKNTFQKKTQQKYKYLLQAFCNAINILHVLLTYDLSEVKQCMHINNVWVSCKGSNKQSTGKKKQFGFDHKMNEQNLCFIFMKRIHKKQLLSLKRSERKYLDSERQCEFENILQKQKNIIKQFGLLLWQVFLDQQYHPLKSNSVLEQQNESPYHQSEYKTFNHQESQTQQKQSICSFIQDILKSMINKDIAYQELIRKVYKYSVNVNFHHSQSKKRYSLLVNSSGQKYSQNNQRLLSRQLQQKYIKQSLQNQQILIKQKSENIYQKERELLIRNVRHTNQTNTIVKHQGYTTPYKRNSSDSVHIQNDVKFRSKTEEKYIQREKHSINQRTRWLTAKKGSMPLTKIIYQKKANNLLKNKFSMPTSFHNNQSYRNSFTKQVRKTYQNERVRTLNYDTRSICENEEKSPQQNNFIQKLIIRQSKLAQQKFMQKMEVKQFLSKEQQVEEQKVRNEETSKKKMNLLSKVLAISKIKEEHMNANVNRTYFNRKNREYLYDYLSEMRRKMQVITNKSIARASLDQKYTEEKINHQIKPKIRDNSKKSIHESSINSNNAQNQKLSLLDQKYTENKQIKSQFESKQQKIMKSQFQKVIEQDMKLDKQNDLEKIEEIKTIEIIKGNFIREKQILSTNSHNKNNQKQKQKINEHPQVSKNKYKTKKQSCFQQYSADQIEEIILPKKLPSIVKQQNQEEIIQEIIEKQQNIKEQNKEKQISSRKEENVMKKEQITIINSKKVVQIDKIKSIIEDYITFINILGDICVKNVKNKEKLSEIQWKRGTYFIYERFYHERHKIHEQLSRHTFEQANIQDMKCKLYRKSNEKEVVCEEWLQFLKSKDNKELLEKIQAENKVIEGTLNKLGTRILKEEKLERKVQYYIRNRSKIQANESKTNTRLQLSRYATKCVVESYDSVIQKNLSQVAIHQHILDMVFGLRIIAELDQLVGQDQGLLYVHLQDYKEYGSLKIEIVEEMVDQLYTLYFPEEQAENIEAQADSARYD